MFSGKYVWVGFMEFKQTIQSKIYCLSFGYFGIINMFVLFLNSNNTGKSFERTL